MDSYDVLRTFRGSSDPLPNRLRSVGGHHSVAVAVDLVTTVLQLLEELLQLLYRHKMCCNRQET